MLFKFFQSSDPVLVEHPTPQLPGHYTNTTVGGSASNLANAPDYPAGIDPAAYDLTPLSPERAANRERLAQLIATLQECADADDADAARVRTARATARYRQRAPRPRR